MTTEPASTPAAVAAARPPAVETVGLTHWYGNVVAVTDVSFALRPGITGLLGPNGAGKSTILHILSGFLRPSAGEVRVFGEPAWRNVRLYRRLGIVPEREAVYGFLSGYDFVLLNARLHGLADPHAATARAIRRVEMEDAQQRASGGYSKGMKQRIKIAAALVHDPQVLLLDEPFTGADPRQRLQMMAMFRGMAAEGRTILFSSHILEEMERLADTVLVLVSGRLAASGRYRAIRRLMTDRPNVVAVRSSDDRRLAGALVADDHVQGLEVGADSLTVRTTDLNRFARTTPRIARELGITLREIDPLDESLETVFEYLVAR